MGDVLCDLERRSPDKEGHLAPPRRVIELRPGRPDRRVLGLPGASAFAELFIDCEEDRALHPVGRLREADDLPELGYAKVTIGGQLLGAGSPKPTSGSYIDS